MGANVSKRHQSSPRETHLCKNSDMYLKTKTKEDFCEGREGYKEAPQHRHTPPIETFPRETSGTFPRPLELVFNGHGGSVWENERVVAVPLTATELFTYKWLNEKQFYTTCICHKTNSLKEGS